ncbi:hypothetical protein B0H16DRAFT_1758689 [Mycena metata]|uniref:Fork-head domain-containing protein n=1 Tax=Mycena metata TaxID=1033252 RepID=A0AAD7ICZ4_9AGAR|nr:hypothetical protein B0H16DRAFT_1758689 [Mycena metata]
MSQPLSCELELLSAPLQISDLPKGSQATDLTAELDSSLDLDEETHLVVAKRAPRKYVLYPIEESRMWDMYKTAQSHFWIAEDFVPAKRDVEKDPVALPLFSAMRAVLAEISLHPDLSLNSIAAMVDQQEAKAFLNYQAMMRNIHDEAYSDMLLNLSAGCTVGELSIVEGVDVSAVRRGWIATQQSLYGGISLTAAIAACADTVFFSTFQLLAGLGGASRLATRIRVDKDLSVDFLVDLCARSAPNRILPTIKRLIQDALKIELAVIDGMEDILVELDKYEQSVAFAKLVAENLITKFSVAFASHLIANAAPAHRRSGQLPSLLRSLFTQSALISRPWHRRDYIPAFYSHHRRRPRRAPFSLFHLLASSAPDPDRESQSDRLFVSIRRYKPVPASDVSGDVTSIHGPTPLKWLSDVQAKGYQDITPQRHSLICISPHGGQGKASQLWRETIEHAVRCIIHVQSAPAGHMVVDGNFILVVTDVSQQILFTPLALDVRSPPPFNWATFPNTWRRRISATHARALLVYVHSRAGPSVDGRKVFVRSFEDMLCMQTCTPLEEVECVQAYRVVGCKVLQFSLNTHGNRLCPPLRSEEALSGVRVLPLANRPVINSATSNSSGRVDAGNIVQSAPQSLVFPCIAYAAAHLIVGSVATWYQIDALYLPEREVIGPGTDVVAPAAWRGSVKVESIAVVPGVQGADVTVFRGHTASGETVFLRFQWTKFRVQRLSSTPIGECAGEEDLCSKLNYEQLPLLVTYPLPAEAQEVPCGVNTSTYVRCRLDINRDMSVSLAAVDEAKTGERPAMSWRHLIWLAICGSRKQQLSVCGIRDALVQHIDWFREHDDAVHLRQWKNMIGQNLTTYDEFVTPGRKGGGCLESDGKRSIKEEGKEEDDVLLQRSL